MPYRPRRRRPEILHRDLAPPELPTVSSAVRPLGVHVEVDAGGVHGIGAHRKLKLLVPPGILQLPVGGRPVLALKRAAVLAGSESGVRTEVATSEGEAAGGEGTAFLETFGGYDGDP